MSGEQFAKIVNSDLQPVAVVAQCLDNQWVSRELLDTMMRRGVSLRDGHVAEQRRRDVRHEYLRSLLNCQQVVVNRAFFLNNQVVYGDFRADGAARDAFRHLLGGSAIVSYLYNEATPTEDRAFSTHAEGLNAWREVVSETPTSCLRLSWDDQENARLARNMQRSFRRQLMVMADFEADSLQRDFGLDEDGAELLRRRLTDVARWAMDTESVTREEFYKKFVVADGTAPADGAYDRVKPFAGVLKQLADLKYNVALPDALSRYPYTPADSLDRTALQEVDRVVSHGGSVSPDDLFQVLKQQAFALVQRPLDVGLTGLEIDHVRQARDTDAWHRYMSGLLRLLAEPERLLKEPEEFTARSQNVYDQYVSLAEELTGIVGKRRENAADRWQPMIRFSVHTLGSVISITSGDDPYIEVMGEVADSIAAQASKAVVRFAVVGRDKRRAGKELETSVDLMQVKFERTGTEWNDLVARLTDAGYVRRESTGGPRQDATLNAPGDGQ
ncbi:hypothetical protein ACFWU3_24375 [Streptomyces sp. NPDC058685]|uniref:hypothetical protein n=1 Tax=Streptomyces sp. NPDC058685 TaxID=3346598 RepID=UPI003656EF74